MLRGSGRRPVRRRRWAWLGRKAPGVDGEHPTFRHGGEPGNEVFAVSVLFLDGAALEPPHHHMMELVGRIEPSWSGRGRRGRR